MPPKKDPNRVMNMLERMGMVRKTDDDGDTPDSSDIDAVAVPVRPDNASREAVEVPRITEIYTPPITVAPALYEEEEEEYLPETITQAWTPPPPKVPEIFAFPERSVRAETKREVGEKMNDTSFWDDTNTVSADTDKFMDIDELYRAFDMKTRGTDTIYLVEEYMRTLPDSLPAESRRAIIMKIVGASGFDFDKLLGDGIDRVAKLNEYAATFAQQTEKIVARHNTEMEALEKQIQRVRELIGERKNLHKKQFLAIETEAQRLKEVLDFITK